MSKLLVIDIDGSYRDVDNDYQPIHDAIGDTISYLRVDAALGVFINDNGMLTNQPLNVAVSMIAGRALYGTCVLCKGDPDDEGDSLPLATRDRKGMTEVAARWHGVVQSAAQAGQDVRVYPNVDTIPPAQFIALPDDWTPGDPIPGAPS